jgi:hypothetical protein
MNKYLILLLSIIFITGCQPKGDCPKTLARVNDYRISVDEFEKKFQEFNADNPSPVTKQEFLNGLITQVLILQDAQSKGLDKNNEFLKTVEKFWEQSLLKVAVENKSKEVAGSAFVSDKSIKETYDQMIKDGKAPKPYDQMYQQIKWQLTKERETRIFSKWLADLRKTSKIKIYDNLMPKCKKALPGNK